MRLGLAWLGPGGSHGSVVDPYNGSVVDPYTTNLTSDNQAVFEYNWVLLKKLFFSAFISGVCLILLIVFDTWGDMGVIIPLFIAGICNCGCDTLLTGICF